MELDYAFFAEAADLHPDGRFFVFGGGIDRINGLQFPSTLPALSLLIKLRVLEAEFGVAHRIRVSTEAPDGTEWIGVHDAAIGPSPPVQGLRLYSSHVVCMSLRGAILPQEGVYIFHIFGDEVELGTLRLYVERLAPAGDVDPGIEGD
jgi:hypothetical protein